MLLLTMLTNSSFTQQRIETLYPTDDAFCCDESLNYNFNLGNLWVGKDSNNGVFVSLIKFNISSIPLYATIDAAELQLYASNDFVVQTGRILELDPSVSWSEKTVTYNNMPYGITDNISKVNFSVHEGMHHIDVKKFVNYWHAGNTNNGFQIFLEDNDTGHWARFLDKEYSGSYYDPQLIVVYTLPDF